MGDFPEPWLRMREPFDHAARSGALVERFAEVMGDKPVVAELGCGLGSGVRFMNAFLPKNSRYVLIDRDEELLAAAQRYMPPPLWERCTTSQRDLRQRDDCWPADVTGVACQALIDLASEEWLVTFAGWLAASKLPVLVSLTVDGRVQYRPSDVEDDMVQAAFRKHQLTDRGFGPSPGPRAAGFFAQTLTGLGYEVCLRHADWSIGADQTEMLLEMVNGIAHAAGEMIGEVAVSRWLERRRTAILRGELSMLVGHLDLLGTAR